jgi:CheY-like chemotaxis protein
MMIVLLVDDDPVIRRLGQFAFESVDEMTLTTARDGLEALNVVDGVQPDVILLDYMMPGMNGDEVLAALRSSPAVRHIPIVFLTGLEDGPRRDSLISTGALGCIFKPFDPTTLASDLLAILGMPVTNSSVPS